MELELSLGETASKPSFGLIEKSKGTLGFCLKRKQELEQDENEENDDEDTEDEDRENRIEQKTINKTFLDYHLQQQQNTIGSKESPLIQLDLLPNTPVPRYNHHEERAAVSCSPPNSGASSFQVDFGTYNRSGNLEVERGGSDEDENGCSRKKLRLSKQQSAFLEESFKEHHTLNPKQKLALAKQLNLRPRQVEVWFQNRRARTKLRQTEVDCELLKRCCERLTQENMKLHKEIQELRALKSSNPFNMQLPATTLTICPSCERLATAAPANPTTLNNTPEPPAATSNKATDFDLSLSTRTTFLPLNQPRIS